MTIVESAEPAAPPAPRTVADTGLTEEAIIELLLKTLYTQGARSGQQLTRAVCLPFEIVDGLLLRLQERRFIEVLRTHGPARGTFVFDLAGDGRARARDALDASQYVGPAPVPLATYRSWIERQSVRGLHVPRQRVREAFGHLVMPYELIEALGPAVNSAASVFLHGEAGNGKTVIAEAIATMLGGDLYLPHAVDIDGQTMSLYDPVHHEIVDDAPDDGPAWLGRTAGHDMRFVRIRRPVIFAGGELSLEQLDLQYDPFTKVYQAPFQLKAAGGVLVIDDFGRQLVAPRDLLNRWIVPLEKRVDYLTLHTGVKFPVPFDCLLLFATNLEPHELVDEAFLRRIQYKIHVASPEPWVYDEIFRRECTARGIPYRAEAVVRLREEYYGRRGIAPRACHPRDLLVHVQNIAKYEDIPAELTDELIDRACHAYFLITAPRALEAHAG